MFVVIVGGGRTGTQLAKTLIQQNHTVHVVENRSDVLSMIHRELPTESVFQGNPLIQSSSTRQVLKMPMFWQPYHS
jgi:trk system potassium uptake protein TrkA